MDDQASPMQATDASIERLMIDALLNLTGKTIDAVHPLTSLNDLGIDSLDVFQVICELERKLGISIPDEALRGEDLTIAQLANRISEALQASRQPASQKQPLEL